MKKIVLAAAAAFTLTSTAALAAEAGPELLKRQWTFDGATGKFDKLQLQRGLQVYREVCASCHSLKYVAFRNLTALGYSEDQVKALAAEYEFKAIDEEGSDVTRKGTPADHFPNPYPNDNFARASNNGALPPDLSLMTKARVGGPNYVYSLMQGYEDPPPGTELLAGMNYNKYFPGHQIGMPKQISDDQVTYADGTKASAEQISADISAFLHWAAEPKLEARHATGFRVMIYVLIFTILAYLLKRKIWARLEKK
ncbi:MAG: cytochrome c1 [Rhodospirillaceae bacterium]|nr:cytochrome c1 [Rhodospirillaceae bacterium]